MDDKEDIFKDLEHDLEKRRKDEKDKEKQKLTQELEKHYEVQGKTNPRVVERVVYLLIILLLGSYVVYDLASGLNPTAGVVTSTTNITPNESTTSTTETTVTTTTVTTSTLAAQNTTNSSANASNAPSLSGAITITIDSISKEKVSETSGYINSVTFIVENGKDKAVTPTVNVYAFDSKIEEVWNGISRGEHKFAEGLPSGGKTTATITLTPRTFFNLNLEKTLILKLNAPESSAPVTARADFYIS